MKAFELTPHEALGQVIAYLQFQEYEYNKLPAEERQGHIWEAVQSLRKARARLGSRKVGYGDFASAVWRNNDPVGIWGRGETFVADQLRSIRTEQQKLRTAVEHVVTHLHYQQGEYEKLTTEQQKGHIWEAVRVLERGLRQPTQEELRHTVEQIRQRQLEATVRKVNEPVQGY